MIIRRANAQDIPQINGLLYQVLNVHNGIRPDLFKAAAKKYSDGELKAKLENFDESIFVAAEGEKLFGYFFCVLKRQKNSILRDIKTLYIDDLCVDESERGKGVGAKLIDYALSYAKSLNCYNVTLNVWAGNDALGFYEARGFTPQKITMEKIISRS